VQKFREALIEGPFDSGDRKMILDMADRFSNYNLSRSGPDSQ
jgi:hypothetical protein